MYPARSGGDFDFTTGNFSFEFWLKVNTYVTSSPYFGNGIWDHTGYSFMEDFGGHGLMLAPFYSSTYGYYADGVSRSAGSWMHIGIVRNGTSLAYYVNGVLDQSFNNFHGPDSSSNVFTIGGSAGSGGMNGVIQEFRVSNTNRSADWITTAYNNQSNPGTFFSQSPWSTASGYPPSCNAGVPQTVRAGTALTLDGSGSFPQDGGSSLSYIWQQVPSAARGVRMQDLNWSSQKVVNPAVTGLVFGPADFQLTVTQSDGESTSCVVNDGAVATDSNGAVISKSGNQALDSAVYNLLGPMIQLGKNGWPFYDTAAQNDAAVQVVNMDTVYGDFWDNPGPGTISVTSGSLAVVGNGTNFTTTFCQGPGNPTLPIPGVGLIVWYPTNDGTGRFGRRLAGYGSGPGAAYIQSCTDDTHMTLAQNSWYSSEAACPTGQTAPCWLQYSLWGTWPAANAWTYGAAPANYYDVVSAYYALYYRSGLDFYLINARKLADRFWSSPELDVGNAFDSGYPLFGFAPQFRCWSIQGMVLRALDNSDGHPDMWAGLHKVWNEMLSTWWLANFPSSPFQGMIDQREWGYGLAQLAECALYDTSATYQQTCRSYIKNSFATSGPGYLNIWPSREDPAGGWLTWYANKSSATHLVNLSYGSTAVSCVDSSCGWASSDFPAAPQSPAWFFNGSLGGLPTNNSQGDADSYCYQPGSSTTCTFIDSNHFTLDRPYDGANCTSGCTRGWVLGSGAPVGWGAEPFFEGILAFAFDLAGRAMACTSSNVPAGCDNPTSAAAYQANSDAVNWMMNNSYRAATDGMYYFAGFMGCTTPISEQNVWCTNGGELSSREYAADGIRGMMVYYQRTGDSHAKSMIDAVYSGLWAKPGTNPIVASPDGVYDNNFDTGGYWLTAGSTPNKLFGQMFGFSRQDNWTVLRSGGPLPAQIETVWVDGDIASVRNATQMQVTVTQSTGAANFPVICAASPCGVPVDKSEGNATLQVQYLSAGGAVLATGQPFVITVN